VGNSREAIKEEIRQRINIVDVVSEYVALKHGGKSFKGLCPFHAEKTPSFTVSEEFQSWHCFGCSEHGDVFSFLMKIENLTFAEALERLAKRAGVELERFEGQQVSRKDQLAKVNTLAAAYYTALLKRSSAALDYLRERGLADQTIEQFHLGFAAPAWDGLLRYLTERRVDLNVAAEAGLIIKNDRGGFYDRFRQRIVFPILDIQERIIGFGGRALGEEQPKYLNSPETPLFSKTRSLYGLNLARKSISDGEFAIVVEGYMDVIAVHQAGFSNCVATLGTALTLEHIGVLSRYTKKVVLSYDADSAGMNAALKGAAMFDEAECDVRIVRLPRGDDPDSLLRKGQVSEFAAAISGALPIVDYKLRILREKYDLSDPAGRASMLKEAVHLLADLRTGVERDKFIVRLAKYHPNFESGTTRAEDVIRRDVEQLIQRRRGDRTALGAVRAGSGLDKVERIVLGLVIRGGAEADAISQSLTADDFSSDQTRAAAQSVFGMFARKRGIYLPELLENSDAVLSRFLSEIAMQDDKEPVNETVLQDYLSKIKNSRLKRTRTSSVLSPYMVSGRIDPDKFHGEHPQEYEEFLKKSGKKPGD
jgi:DNA primase